MTEDNAVTECDAMQAEFAMLLRRSGLHVPPERQPILFRCYVEVRRWSEVIRSWEKTPADEPANTYDIRSVTRVTGTQ